MTCPQCSAELQDSTLFCPRCGSAINRSTTFSYLPAGTPPWPTTVPQRPSNGNFSQPSQFVQQGQSGVGEKLAPKHRRSAREILALVAILVLAPLVGVGTTLGVVWANGGFASNATQARVHLPSTTQQTPAAGTSSTPTTPAQGSQLPTPTFFLTATSTEVGVSVKYPGDWVEDPPQSTSSSSVLDFHPQQRIGIIIFIERFSSSTSAKIGSTNDVNQNNLTQFQGSQAQSQGIVNFQTIPATTPQRTIGGAQWDEQDATFGTNNNGTNVTFHLTTMAVEHSQIYYDILFYTPSTNYDEAVQKYFQPMFDSFKFK